MRVFLVTIHYDDGTMNTQQVSTRKRSDNDLTARDKAIKRDARTFRSGDHPPSIDYCETACIASRVDV